MHTYFIQYLLIRLSVLFPLLKTSGTPRHLGHSLFFDNYNWYVLFLKCGACCIMRFAPYSDSNYMLIHYQSRIFFFFLTFFCLRFILGPGSHTHPEICPFGDLLIQVLVLWASSVCPFCTQGM